jgi:hypothetical protein
VQELDGAGAAVAGGAGELGGGALELGVLLGRERRRGDSSRTFWLRRCSEQSRVPDGPDPALAVGQDLDLDVAGVGDHGLQEHGVVAEGGGGLGAGAGEGLLEVGEVAADPDAPAATTGRGLDHQRVPIRSACCGPPRASSTGPPLQGATGTPPRSANRFAPILSPSARMVSPVGPTNVMPSCSHRSAKPACSATNPQPTQAASARASTSARASSSWSRYGDRGPRRLARTGADADGVVGLADEHRVALRLGVQGDGAGSGAVGLAERTHGVDQTHRGLATVHDRDALEHGWAPRRRGVRSA